MILAGASVALFLSLVLLRRKPGERSRRALLLYMAATGLVLLSVFLYLNGKGAAFGLVLGYGNLIVVPFLLIYIRSLISLSPPARISTLACFMPLGAALLVTAGLLVFGTERDIGRFFLFELTESGWPYAVVFLLENLIVPVGIIPLLLRFNRLARLAEDSFSNTDDLHYSWVRLLLIFELLSWTFFLTAFLFVDVFRLSNNSLLAAVFGAVSVFTVILGVFGISETSIFSRFQASGMLDEACADEACADEADARSEAAGPGCYQRSGLTGERAREIARLLGTAMAEHRYFLDPRLNLRQLSDFIRVPVNQISETLNRHMNTSFYGYINDLRLKAVCEKFEEGEDRSLTLLAIAMDSGFNSKATFNRVFRAAKGCTPSQYLAGLSR